MSSNFHTPISTGAAANAATINAPLGTLDAAVTAVDTRVDTIIADSGTSSTEVVDARATYTVLSGRIDDLALRSNVLLVDPAFTTNAAEKRFATIAAAMAAATQGATIILAPGTYAENVTFSQHDLKLVGSGAAGYYSPTAAWGVGTIIVGTISLNNKVRCTVADLSVDVRASAADGITSGAATTGPECHATIANVVIAGNGLYAAAHGILLNSGGNNRVLNAKIYTIGHGVALRCGYSIVDGIYAESCGLSAVIVKSATGTGDASFVNIANVTAVTGQGVSIEATDASYDTKYINVANVVGLSTLLTLITIGATAGALEHINVANCHSEGNQSATYAPFNIESGSDITFTNCQANFSASYGFRNISGVRVRLVGCVVRNATTARTYGYFAQLNVNGISITGAVANRSTTQSIPTATWTTVAGLAALSDVSGLVAADYISVPTTGIYRLRARVTFASNATGDRYTRFYIVGSGTVGDQVDDAGNTQMDLYNEWIASLTAGYGIQLQVYQDSGGALNLLKALFEMSLIEGT